MRPCSVPFLSFAAAVVIVAGATGARSGMPSMGPMSHLSTPASHGFYDGHKDTFLSTDVSDQAEARAMHVNYSAPLGRVPMADTDDIYLFQGTMAPNQLPVFGSEPGEHDYTPLWHEDVLTWKAGTTPTLLTSDTQIEAAVKAGRLTEQHTHVILNCPIVKVGR
jgi:hypothetical protein